MNGLNQSSLYGDSAAPWLRRAVVLSAGGIGAALLGFALAPLTHADTVSDAVATVTGNTPADAESYLFNWSDWFASPNTMSNGLTTAWGEYTLMSQDASTAFSGSFNDEMAMGWSAFTSGLTAGQLAGGAVTSVADAVPTQADGGDYTPTTLSTVDVDPTTDTTATQYFTGVVNEANILTQSLTNLADAAHSGAGSVAGVNDASLAGVVSDALAFQKQINGEIDVLNNGLPVGDYDHNIFLDSDLKGLLTTENNLAHWAIIEDQDLAGQSPYELAQVDGDFLGTSSAECNYGQDLVNFFNEPSWLHALGF